MLNVDLDLQRLGPVQKAATTMELDVRVRNLVSSESLMEFTRRRIRFALDRFTGQIRRVDIRLADINGARGGIDKQCRVDVILAHGGSVRAESTDERLRDAVDRAAHRIGRRLGRKLERSAHPRRGFRLAS